MCIRDSLGIEAVTQTKTVVIDYSAPNVAKEMHVGNLRSTVIGDALARMYRFAGHHVVARNHVGDWGTPFAMLIEHLLDSGEGDDATLSIGDLDAFYKEARTKFDADDSFKERSRSRVVALQSGDPETLRLWRVIVDQSIAYLDLVYRDFGVTLTPNDVVGESFYNNMLSDVVTDLAAAGLIVESGGALCVFPPGFTNRDGEALPLIVRKSDEGFGYAASDLAAVRDRVDNLHADEMLYVVGVPQAQHFEMVFAVARMAGWLPERVRCEHVTFGNVLGPDRKMFKSRSGETVSYTHLDVYKRQTLRSYSIATFCSKLSAVPERSKITEWSMTSSTGTRGLILFGSPPSAMIASRIEARSTTAGTPVRSCMRTLSGVKAISFASSPAASPWRDGFSPHRASASMSAALTFTPSSWRRRFSKSTLME